MNQPKQIGHFLEFKGIKIIFNKMNNNNKLITLLLPDGINKKSLISRFYLSG